MNRIFKIKKNYLGLSASSLELAKNKHTVAAAIGGLLLGLSSANAEIVNNNSAFNAINDTGETASGYQAKTANVKSTANGFASFAIANGTVAIGAESGASGSGLSYEESANLIDAAVKMPDINNAISALKFVTLVESLPTSYDYNISNIVATDYEQLSTNPTATKTISTYQEYAKQVAELNTIHKAAQNLQSQVGKLLSLSENISDESTYVDNKAMLIDTLNNMKSAYDVHIALRANTTTYEQITKLVELVKGDSDYNAFEQAYRQLLNTDHFENWASSSDLEPMVAGYLNKNIVFNQSSNGTSSHITSESEKEIITNYNVYVGDFNKNGDADSSKLTALTEKFNESLEQSGIEYRKFLASIDEVLLSELGGGEALESGIASTPDWFIGFNGENSSIEDVSSQMIAALKAAEILDMPLDDFITQYRAAILYVNSGRSIEKTTVDSLVSQIKNAIGANSESQTKKDALVAERQKIVDGIAALAKKLGYENPTYEDFESILGSLSPNAISIGHHTFSSGNSSVAIGADAIATGDHSIALGANSAVNGHQSIVIGADSVAVDANDVVVIGSNISVGGNASNAVILGANSTFSAANPSSNITIKGNTYYFAGAEPISVVSVGDEGSERQIINVAAGRVTKTSTDAINGSQLYALASAVEALESFNANQSTVTAGKGIAVLTTKANKGSYNITDYVVSLSDDVLALLNKDPVIPSPTQNITTVTNQYAGDNVIAGKNITIDKTINKDGFNDVIVGLGDDIAVKSVKVGDVVIDNKGINVEGKQITNVAAGIAPTDAVNVSQLQEVRSDVEAGSNAVNVNSRKNSDGSTTYSVDLSQGAKNDIGKISKGLNIRTEDGKTQNYQLGDTVAVIGDGKNISTVTTSSGATQVKLVDDADFNTVKTMKPAEINPTSREVVQGSQLYQTNQLVNQNTQNIKNLNDKVDRNAKQTRKGIAVAAAIGSLPQPTTSGKSMVSAATTHYHGEQGLAVGYSRLSDNGKHIFKLSGATNVSGRKEAVASASYGYQW